MNSYPDGYIYRLTITNQTLWDLVPVGRQLNWGLWCDEPPAVVPSGATALALAVQASKNNTKGYECRCTWETAADDPRLRGSMTLFLSVPLLAGGNRAGLDVGGNMVVAGWTGISRLGHEFSHALTVKTVGL